MNHFQYSSTYYDLLYRDKNYRAESAYIDRLIRQYKPGSISILNLGCGTGKHDFELVDFGYTITGADLSESMINIASKANKHAPNIEFLQADIRGLRLDKKFDVVISMFNVLGYQTSNEDFIAAFETSKYHLKPGGIFIFDIWYSPAVYKHPPEVRIKRFSDGNVKITRLAEPIVYESSNMIGVNYEIIIEILEDLSFKKFNESHHVRHFSTPEIKLFAEYCGLEIIRSEEFMTSKDPASDNWSVCHILKKH